QNFMAIRPFPYIIPLLRFTGGSREPRLPSGSLAGPAQLEHHLPERYAQSLGAEGDGGVGVPGRAPRRGRPQRKTSADRMAGYVRLRRRSKALSFRTASRI